MITHKNTDKITVNGSIYYVPMLIKEEVSFDDLVRRLKDEIPDGEIHYLDNGDQHGAIILPAPS